MVQVTASLFFIASSMVQIVKHISTGFGAPSHITGCGCDIEGGPVLWGEGASE